MGTKSITRRCKYCAQQRPFQKQTPSHILHLLLSVISVGLWIPVWILIALGNAFEPFRCQVCGQKKVV